MTDAVDGHHGSGRGNIVNLLENGAGGGGVGGIFIVRIGGFADDGEITASAEIVFRKSVDHGKQNLQVKVETPDFPFENGERTIDQRSGEASLRMFPAEFLILVED